MEGPQISGVTKLLTYEAPEKGELPKLFPDSLTLKGGPRQDSGSLAPPGGHSHTHIQVSNNGTQPGAPISAPYLGTASVAQGNTTLIVNLTQG